MTDTSPLVKATGIDVSLGGRTILDRVDLSVARGQIVTLIGPNGAGKTTLFRMMVGQEQPDSGELRIGPTVELGYVDQTRDALKPDSTVYEEISGGHETLEMGGRKINARAYVSRFNFRGPDQEKKVGELSGGERNRVHHAQPEQLHVAGAQVLPGALRGRVGRERAQRVVLGDRQLVLVDQAVLLAHPVAAMNLNGDVDRVRRGLACRVLRHVCRFAVRLWLCQAKLLPGFKFQNN